MRKGMILLGILGAAACAPKSADAPAAPDAEAAPPAPVIPVEERGQVFMATFTCPDSLEIYAIFQNDSTGERVVSLAIGDERLRLPQAISADGARFTDGTTTFWNKGKEATFTWNNETRICTTD